MSTSLFNQEYCSSLNSADLFDTDLPLRTTRAFGGTLSLWRRSLDPYVKTIDVNSASFNVLLLNIPGYPITVLINIYLPTSGRNAEYLAELSKLENTMDELEEAYDNPIFMIRGDANASIPVRPSNSRDNLFQYFCERIYSQSSQITRHITISQLMDHLIMP